MEFWIIRHGETQSNAQGRYLGRTDLPLSTIGIRKLDQLAQKNSYPAVKTVYVSPLKRCRQTAELLFPQAEQITVPELVECNFGQFENKNYEELKEDPAYIRWLESGGTIGFPDGETRAEMVHRVKQGILRILQKAAAEQAENVVIVAHGGTIMAALSSLAKPNKNFYDWQVKPACGYRAQAVYIESCWVLNDLYKIDAEEEEICL